MAAQLPSVSIVIPTLNEADNIRPLVARIEATLRNKAVYDIIFVDDHSSDKTAETIHSIIAAGKHIGQRIMLHMKSGKRGKAFSLLEGFALAEADFICILDADLQYPPEAIPKMFDVIENGYDVVVANRILSETRWLRRTLSRLGRKLYGKWLYDLDCDVQSGLKLFRKSVLSHTVLHTTPWTFDLSFLIQARESNHKIGSVSIPFAQRTAGSSKVNVMRVGAEIIFEALKFKIGKRKRLAHLAAGLPVNELLDNERAS